MRPSSVDTSVPACVKRKMLSTNSSTSWPCTSRKYSAIVERGQRDAEAHARRLVHLAVDERGVLENAGLFHFQPEVVALTRALADTGEHRHTTVLAGDADDHFLDHHGLADAGAAEQADLAALAVGLEQVDDLEAGLEHLGGGVEVGEGRRGAVDLPALVEARQRLAAGVERLADDVEHVAEGAVADGHRDAATEVAHRGAADEAVGGAHADGAHAAVADVLGDLGDDRRRLAVDDRRRTRARRCSSGSASGGNSTSTTGPTMATMRPSFRAWTGESAVTVIAIAPSDSARRSVANVRSTR